MLNLFNFTTEELLWGIFVLQAAYLIFGAHPDVKTRELLLEILTELRKRKVN